MANKAEIGGNSPSFFFSYLAVMKQQYWVEYEGNILSPWSAEGERNLLGRLLWSSKIENKRPKSQQQLLLGGGIPLWDWD